MTENKLQIGDPAPDFELIADDGSKVKLSSLRGRRVVVYFYPKDDTPGCTTQACGFRDRYPQIELQNAVVLGLSPDDLASHKRFKTKHNLPFHLLMDEGHRVAEAYGVWGNGFNIRSHFVVDEGGCLADVQVKVKPEDSVQRAMDTLAAPSPRK
jgi:peroxiredoxin Q/BCP